MSLNLSFIDASHAVEESLDALDMVGGAAAEDQHDDIRAPLPVIARVVKREIAGIIHKQQNALDGVAEGEIRVAGIECGSAHEASVVIWEQVSLLHQLRPDVPIRSDLCKWLGVNTSTLRVRLRRERARMLAQASLPRCAPLQNDIPEEPVAAALQSLSIVDGAKAQDSDGEVWLPANEALKRAVQYDFHKSLTWLTRDAHKYGVKVRPRPEGAAGRHKQEVEWNSLAGYLIPPRNNEELDDDELASRIKAAKNNKQRNIAN